MRAAPALATAVLIVITAGALPVLAAGAAPVAFDQSDTTAESTPRIFLAATDPEDDPLTFTIVTGPAHGTLDDCSSGSCTYTPTAGYLGPDSFTWKRGGV